MDRYDLYCSESVRFVCPTNNVIEIGRNSVRVEVDNNMRLYYCCGILIEMIPDICMPKPVRQRMIGGSSPIRLDATKAMLPKSIGICLHTGILLVRIAWNTIAPYILATATYSHTALTRSYIVASKVDAIVLLQKL